MDSLSRCTFSALCVATILCFATLTGCGTTGLSDDGGTEPDASSGDGGVGLPSDGATPGTMPGPIGTPPDDLDSGAVPSDSGAVPPDSRDGAIVLPPIRFDAGAPPTLDGGAPAVLERTELVPLSGAEIAIDGLRLIIPAGALAEPVSIRLVRTMSPGPEGHELFSPVFGFEPAGLSFLSPVTVEIDFHGEPGRAAVYWSIPAEEAYELRETTIEDGRAIATIEHFSTGFVGDENPCGRDLMRDNENCGSCGRSCHNESHVVSCREGVCELDCPTLRADCDGEVDNGCEEDMRGNRDHCGGCGVRCDPGASCSSEGLGAAERWFCECPPGYRGDGTWCADIDECEEHADDCGIGASCENTEGGFECRCPSGLVGDGLSCEDVDECEDGTHDCDASATCVNQWGGYECSCPAGTRRVGGRACEPIDECAEGADDCADVAECTDTPEGWQCSCATGYVGDGRSCENVDECADGSADCAFEATCIDTPGGYECACGPGFVGDGTHCDDVDECEDGGAGCDALAECTNEVGSYRCTCPAGYLGDGLRCDDVDECADGSDDCDDTATCENTPGAYECTCPPGFLSDGRACHDEASEVISVFAGGAHTCALMNNGAVRCWGWGIYGELGYASTEDIGDDEGIAGIPYVALGGVTSDIGLGVTHGCAILEGGELRCWGRNFYGALGQAHSDDVGDDEHPESAPSALIGEPVLEVAGGGEHTCVRLEGGRVRCFGLSVDGQTGYGHVEAIGDDEAPSTAGDVAVGGEVVQLTAGRDHSCALLATGAVRCWGRGLWAPLGYGHTENVGDDELPESAGDVDLGGRAVQIDAGWYHTCAVMETGAVRCWGYGAFGQLGYGDITSIGDDEHPAVAGDVPLGGRAVQVVAGTYHTCALLDTGVVRCWGRGQWGPLGYGDERNVGDDETPAMAGDVPIGGPVRMLAAGSYHTCALLEDGDVRCWGKGEYGRLGCSSLISVGDDETPEEVGTCARLFHRDECALGTATCDANATCLDEDPGYDCDCNPGWQGDGWLCEDIDECARGIDTCAEHGSCTNTPGAYLCSCDAGHEGDGFTCADIDECSLGTDDCALEAECTNTDGGFSCECGEGFGGDGRSCSDIDECRFGLDDCHEDASCTNTVGGFECTCDAPLIGDGRSCTDVDECAEEIDSCDTNATCTNTREGYDCACDAGWQGDGFVCTDIDECLSDPCPDDSTCVNEPGGFVCVGGPGCPEGFEWDGAMCVDVDECATETDECDAAAVCTNLTGGYDCACDVGYTGDGFTCEDIDECALGLFTCGADSHCENQPGSWACACDEGYGGDGTFCENLDECFLGIDDCGEFATCVDTEGAYICECDPGFFGDGLTCADDDQCLLGTDDCDEDATCTDLPESYRCDCDEGYTADGFACFDVDECELGLDDCSPNALCENLPGTYECSCRYGYEGDGVTCEGDELCVVIDDFEVGEWPSEGWRLPGGGEATGFFDADSAHDGRFGLRGETHLWRNERVALGTPGDLLSAWVRRDEGSARVTLGLGSDADGSLLFVLDASAETAQFETLSPEGAREVLASVYLPAELGRFQFIELLVLEGAEVVARVSAEDGVTPLIEVRADLGELSAAGVTLAAEGAAAVDGVMVCVPAPPIDECAAGTDTCDDDAICTDTLGGFECACPDGYVGDGFTCDEVDECADGTAVCSEYAECQNTPGSFECVCNEGFKGDGFICIDQNECLDGSHECDATAVCENSFGGYECICPAGYEGDGRTCTDVDECAAGLDLCSTDGICTNTDGGYECECAEGFLGDGWTCDDVDECADGSAGCSPWASCGNTPGSFECVCDAAFRGDGFICEDIDECSSGTDGCHDDALCTNSMGSYACTCNPGFAGNGFECHDLDECALGLDSCAFAALCINTYGSYTCDCYDGFTGDGFTCDDVDECAADPCDARARCENFEGSFECRCDLGYFGNGLTCTDRDECAFGLDDCHDDATCTNTAGGFDCTCPAGFAGDGRTCADVDECASGAASCDAIALCTNTSGGYDCTCPVGYDGDGGTCTDVDECLLGRDDCDASATCLNEPGGFTCECPLGYAVDGGACIDAAIDAQAVSAGGHHSCALMGHGIVRCWGQTFYGQTGYGSVESLGDDEPASAGGHVFVGEAVTQLATGGYHTCVLLDDGAVRCWGLAESGQLGQGNVDNIGDDETPAVLPDVEVGGLAQEVASGRQHSCALLMSGDVVCWGANASGQLGYGHTQRIGDDEVPALAGFVSAGGALTHVVAGDAHTCALSASGEVVCWGEGEDGQLGYGTTNDVGDDELPSALGVVDVGATVVQLSAGGAHTCALTAAGNVRCWGRGLQGRLGYGSIASVGDDEAPSSVGDVPLGAVATQVSAGLYSTCAVLETGAVRCWGAAGQGQLGYGTLDNIGDDELPSAVGDVVLGVGARDVSVGFSHACAVTATDAIRCWGLGSFGALGYGNRDTVGDDESPVVAGDVPLF